MKKVKIISSWAYDFVEENVNYFVSTHDVTDIQFQATGNSTSGRTYAVMIVYEEGSN